MKCNNCGADLADNAKFCTSCGASVQASTPQDGPRHCTNCGSQLPDGTSFCTNCGQKQDAPMNQVRQGAKEIGNKLANTFKGKNSNTQKIAMIAGCVVLALLLIYFIFGALFGGGKLTAKKAADIVEDVFEEAMNFDFEDARKHFSITARDEADYFIGNFQDIQNYFASRTDKSLDDLIDIEVEPVEFFYNLSLIHI